MTALMTVVDKDVLHLAVGADTGEQYHTPRDLVSLRTLSQPVAIKTTTNVPSIPSSIRSGSPLDTPRTIQNMLRAGLNTADVAALIGTTQARVRRFESPVAAELEHVITSVLGCPGPTGSAMSFGEHVNRRLTAMEATPQQWASWRAPNGSWVVSLSFLVNQRPRQAQWQFELKARKARALDQDAAALICATQPDNAFGIERPATQMGIEGPAVLHVNPTRFPAKVIPTPLANPVSASTAAPIQVEVTLSAAPPVVRKNAKRVRVAMPEWKSLI